MDDVMLERAKCAVVRMEILYCDYVCFDQTECVGRVRNFVNGLDGEIYEVHTPDGPSMMCRAPSIWIIRSEISEGVRLPRRE